MAYTPHTWVNNHVPAINETHLNEMEAGIVSAHTLSDPASRVCYVSPGFAVDTDYRRFDTIQAAITFMHDASWYSDLSSEEQGSIIVFPGEYKEQLTCWDYIKVESVVDKDNQGDKKTIVIRPPDDKKTEAILVAGSDYVYNFIGITFTADSVEKGDYAEAINGRFYNCRFNNGGFADGSAAYSCGILCVGCTFNGTKSINYTGARGHSDRDIYLYDCWGYADIVVDSTFVTGSPYLEMMNCHFKAKVSVGGAWSIQVINSRVRNFTGSPDRNNFDTTGDITVLHSIISGGIHIVQDPAVLYMERCNFNEYDATAITGADITADVTITNVDYVRNIQQNGISGNIQITCPVKAVGCEAVNRYYSMQDAIDSISVSGVVDLRESLTGLAELTIPSNTNVTIDGHKLYSLTFTGDVVELQADEELIFYGLSSLNGGNIEVNGNNAYVGFEECLTANAYVTMTSGTSTYCLVYTSTIKAPTGHSAIVIDNVNAGVVVGYSRVQGAAGSPGTSAVVFNAVADDKLKAKFSVFIHGDKTTSDPITTTVGKVYVSIYNSAGNSDLVPPATISNRVSSAGNVADAQIIF